MRSLLASIITASLVTLILAGLPDGSAVGAPANDRSTFLDSLSGITQATVDSIDQHLPAIRAQHDSTLVAALLARRGRALYRIARYGDAEPTLAEALALARATDDSATTAHVQLTRGWLLERLGRFPEAAAAMSECAHLGQSLGNPFFHGRGLLGVAYHTNETARYARAESLYAVARQVCEAAADTFGALWASNGTGLCLWDLNRLAAAESVFVATEKAARNAGQTRARLSALNNLGGVRDHQGFYDLAMAAYEQAWNLTRENLQIRDEIPPALNIVQCRHRLGQLDSAEALLDSLRQRVISSPASRSRLPEVLDGLAFVQLKRGRHALAARTCRSALSGPLPPSSRHIFRISNTLVFCLVAMDSLEAATEVVGRMEQLPVAQLDAKARYSIAQQRARVWRAQGRPLDAAKLLGRAGRAAQAAGLVKRSLSLPVDAGRAFAEAGRPDSARAYLELALRSWETTRTLPTRAVWREERSQAARQLFDAFIDLAAPPGSPMDQGALDEAFSLIQRYKARTLQERIVGLGGSLEATPVITLAALQDHGLKSGELFIDTYLGPERGLIFAITPDTTMALATAGREAVRLAVDMVHGNLAATDRSQAPTPVKVARDMLADGVPTSDLLTLIRLVRDAAQVIWSPDDALHRLPLTVLLPADHPQAVSRVPSATSLATLRATPAAREDVRGTILALAGATDALGRPLAGAQDEVDWLKKRFRGVHAVTDADELTGDLADALVSHDVLHFAAHADLVDQRPWDSALVFSDLRLPARVVAELSLDARLAVIASCSSAGNRVLSGEGLLGLAAGFQSAGVPDVVATLWPVSDGSAALFCRRFYEELADDQTPATALTRAQSWLRSREDTAHPHHWAGYVLLGTGQQHVPLETASPVNVKNATATLVGLAVAFLLFLMVRRRRRVSATR